MSRIGCFDKIDLPDGIKKKFNDFYKEGMSEQEQKEFGRQIAKDYHKQLYDAMGGLKAKLKLPSQAPHDLSGLEKEHGEINEEYKAKVNASESHKMTGVTHAQMDETAREFGLPEYKEDPETIASWDKQADERLAKPNAIPELLNKLRNGEHPDKVETRMMIKYVSDLKAKAINGSDEALTNLKRAKDLMNISGREMGKAFRARQGENPVESTLPDYMIREMDASGVDKLTESQKKQATKDFTEITSAEQEFRDKAEKLEAEVAKLKAEKEYAKQSKTTTRVNKTKEEYVKERKDILDNIKKKWDESKGQLSATVIPYADRLVKIAPDVAKLLKSYAEEGIDKLSDVVSKIHEDFKNIVPDVTEKDIHNIIAGEYNEKQSTKSELQTRLYDLKTEAKLINQLEKAEAGEPKTPKAEINKNKLIKELRDKIKGLTKDENILKNIKTRNETESKKIQDQLDKGDFTAEEKKPHILEREDVEKKYPELYKQAVESRDKLVKLRQEREIRLIKQKYGNRTKAQKFGDYVVEVLNVPRSIMSSVDFSAPFRQGIIPTIAHPDLALKAFGEMFKQAFSQKKFDTWFFNLRDSPEFKVMEESGLFVADPHDFRLTAKEEVFMSNLAEKIPLGIGKVIKGSERAYVTYLNKMRVDLFNRGADILAGEGKTIKNSKKEYEALASWVNNSTGRGGLNEKMAGAAPLLNAAFFSPRLIASRLNLLNPAYYAKLPKNIRVRALADMAKFIGFGLTVLGVAKMGGADVELDPRSSDFLKIKIGDTRYDIWGGFQQYIRVATQLFMGESKSSTSGKVNELDGKGYFGRTRGDVLGTFVRGKLSPVPSMTVDFLKGRKTTGEKVSPLNELQEHFTPLLFNDVKDAMKDGNVKSAIMPFIASTFGVSVQTYNNKTNKSDSQPSIPRQHK